MPDITPRGLAKEMDPNGKICYSQYNPCKTITIPFPPIPSPLILLT